MIHKCFQWQSGQIRCGKDFLDLDLQNTCKSALKAMLLSTIFSLIRKNHLKNRFSNSDLHFYSSRKWYFISFVQFWPVIISFSNKTIKDNFSLFSKLNFHRPLHGKWQCYISIHTSNYIISEFLHNQSIIYKYVFRSWCTQWKSVSIRVKLCVQMIIEV